jgi:hypothetical protein
MPNLNIPAPTKPQLKINQDLIEAGNIDLTKRPKVKNPDGSVSTVRSIGIEMDGMHFLIPTVVGNKVVSNDEAIAHFQKTNQHLGIYKSKQAAKRAGEILSAEQKKYYGL